jgi:DNA-binding LacI/PurR family transcriptional regulator
LLNPSLTSIVIPFEDIAVRVVERALRQVENGQDSEPGEIVPTLLRLGRSIPPRPGRGARAS